MRTPPWGTPEPLHLPTLADALQLHTRQINELRTSPMGPVEVRPGEGRTTFINGNGDITADLKPEGLDVRFRGAPWPVTDVLEMLNQVAYDTKIGLAQEITDRKGADAAEANARAAADNSEASARASADSAEASARASGDASTLSQAKSWAQSLFDAERANRQNSDGVLVDRADRADADIVKLNQTVSGLQVLYQQLNQRVTALENWARASGATL